MSSNLFFIKNENALVPEYACSVEPIGILDARQMDMRDGDKICINSESCLEVVHTRLKDGHTKNAIDLLKDKFAFRNALAPLFPDFHFHKTSLCSLENVDRRSIIKPVRGFFSAGVHELQPNQSLDSIKQKIAADVEKLSCYFPPSVLSSDDWLVEDYIEGEEISIDMYFNEEGAPVILNITAHPMPKDLAYLNAVYWTSDDLMRRWYQQASTFFDYLNKNVLNVTNFPIHGEFRIHNNCLIPIELNPLRFGGFGLADLAYYGWGINSYDAFFKGEEPNWEDIWQSRQANRFCWVLAYNGKNIDKTIQKPNHEQFISFCGKENLLHYRALEWEKQPVFAIAYLSCKGVSTIDALLSVDFNQFF